MGLTPSLFVVGALKRKECSVLWRQRLTEINCLYLVLVCEFLYFWLNEVVCQFLCIFVEFLGEFEL